MIQPGAEGRAFARIRDEGAEGPAPSEAEASGSEPVPARGLDVVERGPINVKEGRLRFHPAPEPSPTEIAALSTPIRRRVPRRMLRLGAIPEESARELLARPRAGSRSTAWRLPI